MRDIRPPIFLLGLLGLASLASALSQLQVESGAVGDKVLILTVDDSIQALDLSRLKVDGYEIENAAFVEDLSPDPTRYAPQFLDLSLPGNGHSVDFVPTPGTLVVDLPPGFFPTAGAVLSDTAFGGYLRKVVDIDGTPQSGLTGLRWILKTIDADLTDAVLDCDIAFHTRLDLTQNLSDVEQTQDLLGSAQDGSSVSGQLGFSLKGGRVAFQPVVTGHIRIHGGKVEVFQIKVDGDCEVSAAVVGNVMGTGEFDYEEELPGNKPLLMPIGSGLFLKIQNRPFLRVEANSKNAFAAAGDFRILNSLSGELGFGGGQWRPLAQNKITYGNKSARDISGEGQIKFSVKPRMEFFLDGVQGPAFTFEPFARFSSVTDSLNRAPGDGAIAAQAAGLLGAANGSTSGPTANAPGNPAPGFVPPSVYSALPPAASAPTVSPYAVSPSVATPAPGDAFRPLAVNNKLLALGTNITMDARTNFIGPSVTRSFLLFNREQTMLSAPREGTLSLREADSSRIALQAQTFPKSDYFIVQQKLGAGPWETLPDKTLDLKIRLANLKPSSTYRFRVLGVNAMGIGPAFPPDGVAYTTPAMNRAPFQPLPTYPESSAVVSDSALVLSWKGGDPDAGDKLSYTVLLDTHYPPAAVLSTGLSDTSLEVDSLPFGPTYYWKVIAFDGVNRSEGSVRAFKYKALAPPPRLASVTVPAPEPYPSVLVSRGSYRREDGQIVTVGPFFLGRFEVTQGEYQKKTGFNPAYHLQDSLPVERVTWDEAAAFCQETGGRLPTEAEWEYAARAGASSEPWNDATLGDYAWYRDNSQNQTQKVGQKKSNAWGLHDMAGNVFEWVQDWYGEYSSTAVDHPRGPETGTAKVIRGASWYSEAANLNLSARYSNRPGFRNFKVGFRCAKDVESAVSPMPAATLARKADMWPVRGQTVNAAALGNDNGASANAAP